MRVQASRPARKPWERSQRSQGTSGAQRALEALGTPANVLQSHGIAVRGRQAHCPFHEDRTPSLSLFRGKDGRERWTCHAGCGYGDAIDLEAKLTGRSLGEVINDAAGR
jgi:hypothetical protein